MSHFLGARLKEDYLHKKHAVVAVRVTAKKGLRMVEDGAIGVCREDTSFVELPDDIEVQGPDGKRIPRDGRLVRLVTTSTFDPFHCVADVAPELWPWALRQKRRR